jgi:hypothetical protein
MSGIRTSVPSSGHVLLTIMGVHCRALPADEGRETTRKLRKKSVGTPQTTTGLKPALIACALRGPEVPLPHGNVGVPSSSAAC